MKDNREYTHYRVPGYIAEDRIACTGVPLKLEPRRTTDVPDLVTCPACIIALVHRATERIRPARAGKAPPPKGERPAPSPWRERPQPDPWKVR